MIATIAIRNRFAAVAPHLTKRGRRSFAALEARSARHGTTMPLAWPAGLASGAIGRRKTPTATSPAPLDDVLALANPPERGGPSPQSCATSKRSRRLASELHAMATSSAIVTFTTGLGPTCRQPQRRLAPPPASHPLGSPWQEPNSAHGTHGNGYVRNEDKLEPP